MAYYRGDYYRGDYYRGDIFKSIVKGIGGAVKGFVTGGPLGAITGAVGAVAKRPTPTQPQLPPMLQLPVATQAGFVGGIGTAIRVGSKIIPPPARRKGGARAGRGPVRARRRQEAPHDEPPEPEGADARNAPRRGVREEGAQGCLAVRLHGRAAG